MKISISFFIIFIIIISCNDNPKNIELSKLDFQTVIQRINNNDFQISNAVYKDSMGNSMTKYLREKLNKGELFREFYVDNNDIVKEIRVRFLKSTEVFKQIQLSAGLSYPFRGFSYMEIDCNALKNYITDSYSVDQQVRLDKEYKNITLFDEDNKHKILSIIEKCGWSFIDKEDINRVFILLQHMDSNFMARYYLKFKEYHNQGILSDLNYGRMVDRLLMNNGFKQVYGTQIIGESIYDIKDPLNVNSRRKSLDLISIEEYSRSRGFEFHLSDHL